jgi:hypothetical protein
MGAAGYLRELGAGMMGLLSFLVAIWSWGQEQLALLFFVVSHILVSPTDDPSKCADLSLVHACCSSLLLC